MTAAVAMPESDRRSAILSRVIDPNSATLSSEAARSILALKFVPADVKRMNRLADANRRGSITPDQSDELDAYLFVGRFLALIQAKARESLGRQPTSRS